MSVEPAPAPAAVFDERHGVYPPEAYGVSASQWRSQHASPQAKVFFEPGRNRAWLTTPDMEYLDGPKGVYQRVAGFVLGPDPAAPAGVEWPTAQVNRARFAMHRENLVELPERGPLPANQPL